MRAWVGFIKRNVALYFADRQTVFFSLLSSMIILALYLLFLRENYSSSIQRLPDTLGIDANGVMADRFVNALVLTGMIGSAMITIPFHCLMTMIHDREEKKEQDILITPMNRAGIVIGYYVAAVISTIIMGTIVLLAGLMFLTVGGNQWPSLPNVLKLFGLTVVAAFSQTAIFMPILLFIKTTAAASAISGLLSAVSGFLIGAYIPISEFGEAVQRVCYLFPGTGITVLYRGLLSGQLLEDMAVGMQERQASIFLEEMKSAFGYRIKWFGEWLSSEQTVLYIAAVTLACLVVLVLLYRKGRKYTN
ncbi:MAG: ABC transporter permease [Eubacteriales bacterium]|nr:ABC transporter permease [Eubacteriales bacterium]